MNRESNETHKYLLNQSGKLILETTFIFPILMVIFLNLLSLSVHSFKQLELDYIVHHNAIVSVDEEKYNANFNLRNIHKYTISFKNMLEHGYKASKDNFKSTQTITDPIGLIRNVDVLGLYINRAEQILGNQSNILNRIRRISDNGEPESFDTHASAADYLRNHVLGESKKLETPMGVRVIDAIDQQGVVHQAFLTFNETQLKIQLNKDKWLLQDGENVNGVVWHFFKKTGSNQIGPSTSFVHFVQSFGVVVYIHINE